MSMKKEVGLSFRILLALVICGANVYRAYLEGGVEGGVFAVVISILLLALLIIYRREEMSMKKEVGLLILLLMLCTIVAIINPKFLQAINLQNLARQIGAFGIFSIGLGPQ